MLAQSTAYPVVVGQGSIGPFALPAGAKSVEFVLQRATLPTSLVLKINVMGSFDGGATFQSACESTVNGGAFPDASGTPLAETWVQTTWETPPSLIRLDVDSSDAFNADFSVTAV